MTVKAPPVTAAVAVGVALFALYAAYVSATWGDELTVYLGLGFAVFSLVVARVASSSRLIGTPEGLAHPRDPFTWADRFVPWEDVVEARFTLQTAMAWPVLVLQVRGEKEARYIRFPLVSLEKRARMMAFIQERIEAAKARETASETPRFM